MVKDLEQTYNQLLDNLFQATDTIISKRLEHLDFDKTILCEIISCNNAQTGEYLVSDGSSDFLAYSENTEYNEGTWVYVTIPKNDFSQLKTIIGKYITGEDETVVYSDPFNMYLNVTDNIVPINKSQAEWGLIANDASRREVLIWEIGVSNVTSYFNSLNELKIAYNHSINTAKRSLELNQLTLAEYDAAIVTAKQSYINGLDDLNRNYDIVSTFKDLSAYDRLGIRANFKTLLDSYNVISGTYGLGLKIIGLKHDTVAIGETDYVYLNLTLDSSQMIGNPYSFMSWSEQKLVFDISSLENIVAMQLYLYQNNDFKDVEGQRLNNFDSMISTETSESETALIRALQNQYLSTNNLLVKDIYISLGYDMDEFDDNQAVLYTLDSLTYTNDTSDKIKPNVNKKNLFLRWIKKDDNITNIITDKNNIPTWDCYDNHTVTQKPLAKVHWYKWVFEDSVSDKIAGDFWQEQPTLLDSFNWNEFVPNTVNATEQIKVIIETPTDEWIDYQVDNEADNFELQARNELEEENPDTAINQSDIDARKAQLAEDYKKELIGSKSYYESNVVEFINEKDVINAASSALIRGFEIVCDEEGYNGTYRLYNEYGNLINIGDANKERFLTARFSAAVFEHDAFEEADEITWFFPRYNTMIAKPTVPKVTDDEGNEVDDKNISIKGQGNWWKVTKKHVKFVYTTSTENNNLVNFQSREFYQPFKIKSQYIQNNINNTIRCQIKRNGQIYEAQITLYFSVAGNSGTNYTLNVRYEKYSNGQWIPLEIPWLHYKNGDKIKLIPYLTTYAGEDISDQVTFSGEWMKDLYNDDAYQIFNQNPEGSGSEFILELKNPRINGKSKYYHLIFKITASSVEIAETKLRINLKTYCPIAICFDDKYLNYDGNNKIIYDLSGTRISYYKDPYVLYTKKGADKNITWSMRVSELYDTRSISQSSAIYDDYPSIDESGVIHPVNFYLSQNKRIASIVAIDQNGSIVLCQPLYIAQDIYGSSFLNDWDNKLKIDTDNNTIMSAMVGAGYKDNNNAFNGVLMGTLNKAGMLDTGLYGFSAGAETFGFKNNGTAFIGPSGKGRIEFDGSKSTITSSGYKSGNGILLDLDAPILDVSIKYNDQPKSLMKFTSSAQYLQSIDYDESNKTGMKINLASGRITGYDIRFRANKTDNAGTTVGRITLDSTVGIDKYPLRISTASDDEEDSSNDLIPYFKVKWDGTMYARKGIFSGRINATSFNAYDNNGKLRARVDDDGLRVYASNGSTLIGQLGGDESAPIITLGKNQALSISSEAATSSNEGASNFIYFGPQNKQTTPYIYGTRGTTNGTSWNGFLNLYAKCYDANSTGGISLTTETNLRRNMLDIAPDRISMFVEKEINDNNRSITYELFSNKLLITYDTTQDSATIFDLNSNGTLKLTGKLITEGSIEATNGGVYSIGAIKSEINFYAGNTYGYRGLKKNIDFSQSNLLGNSLSIGRVDDDNYIHFADTDATGVKIHGVYRQSISNGRQVLINDEALVGGVAGSSRRYKNNISLLLDKQLDPHLLYNIEVVQFKYNKDYLVSNDLRKNKLIPGFIAEQVYEHYPIAVDMDEENKPNNWNERYIIPPMLALIQEQHKEIEQLKQQVQALINR